MPVTKNEIKLKAKFKPVFYSDLLVTADQWLHLLLPLHRSWLHWFLNSDSDWLSQPSSAPSAPAAPRWTSWTGYLWRQKTKPNCRDMVDWKKTVGIPFLYPFVNSKFRDVHFKVFFHHPGLHFSSVKLMCIQKISKTFFFHKSQDGCKLSLPYVTSERC